MEYQPQPTNNSDDDAQNAFISTAPIGDPDTQNQKDTARRRLFWFLVCICVIVAGLLAWEITEQILTLQ